MSEWADIRALRTDMSGYLMHCTKGRSGADPYDVLKEILFDGFLRPTYAVRTSQTGTTKPSVRGPHPAVCLTEQPLQFFIRSVQATWGTRYPEFAVALRKDDLFHYGGRPVIYDDDRILGRRVFNHSAPPDAWVYDGGLPRDQQYRWVGYDPTVLWTRPYPVDWTHEREWRARPNEGWNIHLDLTGHVKQAVPLILPTERSDSRHEPSFIVLVDTEQRKTMLRSWAAGARDVIALRGNYWEAYSTTLAETPIYSFEAIKGSLEDSGQELGRLEDFLPAG